MIHLARNYALGTGLRCTRSPFTRGRIEGPIEFGAILEDGKRQVCKRCAAIYRKEREAELKKFLDTYGE